MRKASKSAIKPKIQADATFDFCLVLVVVWQPKNVRWRLGKGKRVRDKKHESLSNTCRVLGKRGGVLGLGFKTFPLSPFPFTPPSELGELLASE